MISPKMALLLAGLLLSTGSSIKAADVKSTLEGVVTDAASHQPLENASIFIHELKLITATDKSGHYIFEPIPEGNFTVEVSFIGYRSTIENIKTIGSITRNFSLSRSVVEGENVTVTGVSSATILKKSPIYISVVSKKELDRSPGMNLLESVAKQPGVSIVTTGPAIAKPFIRGLGYNRVVTISDGVRQEGQQWGDEHGLEMDEYSAQKIEILRGPASLMYGSDAIGGVINVIRDIPVANNTIKLAGIANYNSNNDMMGRNLNLAGNINGFNWSAYKSGKTAADYHNAFDGYVLNSRFKENNYGLSVGLNKGWGFSRMSFSNFDQRLGMVEGTRDEDGAFILDGYSGKGVSARSSRMLVPNQLVNHLKWAWDNSITTGNGGRITLLGGFQQNMRKEFGNAEQPTVPGAILDLQTINYNAAYHFPVNRDWRLSAGFGGMSQHNKNRGLEAIIPDYSIFDFGVYGYASKSIHRTNLSGGIRYDNRNMNGEKMIFENTEKFAAFSKKFSSISASVGFSHEVNKHILLKANMSRGFRSPNASELAANGEHEGTMRYEIGNPALKNESSFSLDGGIQVVTEHVDFFASLYHNDIKNYIFFQKLPGHGGTDSLIGYVPAFRFAQQNAKLAGIEAGLDIHPHPLDWLHFENTFSWVRGKFLSPVDGSQNLPQIAPASLLTELRAEFVDPLKWFKNGYLKLEMDNLAAQNRFFAGFNTESATAGYTLLNAGLGVDIEVAGKRRATIILGVYNITDKAYQSHLSRLKYLDVNPATGRTGVFNMGRNFSAKLIVPFEWKLNM